MILNLLDIYVLRELDIKIRKRIDFFF